MRVRYILVLDTEPDRLLYEKTEVDPPFIPRTGDSIRVAGEHLRVSTVYAFSEVVVSAYTYLIHSHLDVDAFLAALPVEGWRERAPKELNL